METERIEEVIEESIRLELNVASLYQIFSTLPEDHDFWWQLYMEEKSHATLIRAARDSFLKRGWFPAALVADSIEDLRSSNEKIEGLIKQCKTTPPDRHEACRIAVELENEAGELHFTQFMDKEAEDALETVFQQLNRDDKEHEQRIRAHCLSIEVDL
ncbi:hypothetical protein P4C99_19450 [Pontiellaceae bacterium B1224]|nr:hypothetical protein [Pontiellaceae bacterium B1224]